MPNPKVLIVDDDPSILLLCHRILASEGYNLTDAKTSDEALTRLDAETFDLLLTDIRLPGLTGLQMAQRLREQGVDLVVVTMTGYSNMEMAIQALSLGVDEFLVKPFTPESLRITIARALEKARLRRENARLRTLVPLFESARGFAGARTREKLVEQIVKAVTNTVSADGYVLMLVDENKQQLELCAAQGLVKDNSRGATFPLGQLAELDFSQRRGIQIWRGSDLPALPFELGIRSEDVVMCAPLFARERALGYLLAINVGARSSFSPSDAEATGILVGQAAIALDNARLLEEMSAAYENVRGLERLKSEIINIAAHEIRTPISILLASAFLLDEQVPSAAREHVSVIVENAERLRRIADDMLSLKYLQTGQVELRLEILKVSDAVRAVADAYHALALERAQALRLDLQTEEEELNADRSMLELMLGNLISNAIKFSPRESEIQLQVRGDERHITFIVRDQSQGLPVGEREHIFEPFYQVDHAMTRRYGGLGVGLALTREMVRAHRGQIWVERNANGGNAFLIRLPRRIDLEQEFIDYSPAVAIQEAE